jgi:hypothetical protein
VQTVCHLEPACTLEACYIIILVCRVADDISYAPAVLWFALESAVESLGDKLMLVRFSLWTRTVEMYRA